MNVSDGGIYLDNAATTPLLPEVWAAMEPVLRDTFGNPSSLHTPGREARRILERARTTVADCLRADESEISFTGGGSEADELGVRGLYEASGRSAIVTTAIEHAAMLRAVARLELQGCRVSRVGVGPDGLADVADVMAAVDADTALVSIMAVNNETGAIQPVEDVAARLAGRGIPVFADAVQALPCMPIDVRASHVASFALSGHKIHGPKGAGVLFVRRGTPFVGSGGTQEFGRRSGTENVAAIVGFARALELLCSDGDARMAHMQELSRRFVDVVTSRAPAVIVNGPAQSSKGGSGSALGRMSPHIISLTIPGVPAQIALMQLDLQRVYASAGSACAAGSPVPSHVLRAMGLAEDMARATLRFSFSARTTMAEVETAATVVAGIAKETMRLGKRILG
jgi:cysteine desulfurase